MNSRNQKYGAAETRQSYVGAQGGPTEQEKLSADARYRIGSLDTTIFDLSNENCMAFLDPLIESWDIDLATFCIEIVLNQRVTPGHHKTFVFMERGPDKTSVEEPGLKNSLQDPLLSGDVTGEELIILRTQTFQSVPRQRNLDS